MTIFRLIFGKRLLFWTQRPLSAIFLMGQALFHLIKGQVNLDNTLEQMDSVGPKSLPIALLTSISVALVFTIQVAQQFIRFGTVQIIGGVTAIALSRELTPVLTAVVVAGRIGSAFAAEIGTMKVTEQIDALYMLETDPVNYLVLPRIVACCLMLPLLTIVSFVVGMSGALIIADTMYGISRVTFLDSVQNFLQIWDLTSAVIKSVIFGLIIAVVGCNWGLTTSGGAKGVGESTTSAVVTALICIFVVNFFLSWLMFQGSGSDPFS